MKKVLLASVLLAVFGFSAQTFANSAVVIAGESCGMLAGGGGFVVTNDTKRTASPSPNGNTVFQCRTDLPGHDGGAYHFDFNTTGGALCGVLTQDGFVTTENWKEVISSSGNAVLTCHYNSKK